MLVDSKYAGMIEVYLLVTLAAIGYMMNASTTKAKSNTIVLKRHANQSQQRPTLSRSQGDIYHSAALPKVEQEMMQRSQHMNTLSRNPRESGVISKNYAYEKNPSTFDMSKIDTAPARKIKLMTGETVSAEDFTFNNMMPYFGGHIRQNMTDDANKNLLESYTGVSSADFKKKCEVASFYDNKRDMANINGMKNQSDFMLDRMNAPRIRNNVTPVEQVRVGPGLNQGYSSTPTGGYQQFSVQDVIMPKCVDQLRVANNPKTSYEGRVVDGMKGSMRAEVTHMDKNRASTVIEQTEDNYFRTTGAYLKEASQPVYEAKHTNRVDTTREYMGGAGNTMNFARVVDPASVRPSTRVQLDEAGVRNAYLGRQGVGTGDDYGKSTIMVYDNERDITTTRVYQGNLTSLVKAIVAPITDAFKGTRKDEMIDNPRHFGNVTAQIPDKPTLYDPNDVARATIKETTIHEAVLGNLKGNEKITVHDPNDVARTTTKETTIHDAIVSNLKGSEKLTIYDPNDIARTTIKETLIHDEIGTGTITGPKQVLVYDPDEVAKATIRETLQRMDYEMNIASAVRKGTIYDPEDIARRTMKETLTDKTRDGNIGGVEGTGDYKTTEFVAPNTQKQFLSDNDYYGTAARTNADGYIVANVEAPNTHKQFLSDNDYYGVAEAGANKAQTSYDNMYNAHISSQKESVLEGREPTQTGDKKFNGGECIALGHKKQECDQISTRYTNNIDKVSASTPEMDEHTLTRMKKTYGERDDRLDPALLQAFKDNPYTKPLNSVA
jgi:hypothetical protein